MKVTHLRPVNRQWGSQKEMTVFDGQLGRMIGPIGDLSIVSLYIVCIFMFMGGHQGFFEAKV